MKKWVILSWLSVPLMGIAQKQGAVTGCFAAAPNKEIRLVGYYGTRDSTFAQTTTDNKGCFTLTYPKTYVGAGLLQVKELTSLILILNNEKTGIDWANVKDFNSISFKSSPENEYFQKAYIINESVNKKLAGLKYLLPLYSQAGDKSLASFANDLKTEIAAQEKTVGNFENAIPAGTYVKGYLTYRKLLDKGQEALQKKDTVLSRSFKIAVDKLDFSNTALYNSGLVKNLLDDYFEVLLNAKDSATSLINKFTDALVQTIKNTPELLNDYSGYLFKTCEKYQQTDAAAHLAVKLLGDNKCTLDNNQINLFEQYRKMAVGAVAPPLVFTNSSNIAYKSLSDVPAKYRVVVFGASWCQQCQQEIPQLKEYAPVFKTKYNAKIVFVSLDTDTASYHAFIKDADFTSTCDLKSWQGQAVNQWYVAATPSIFIINEKGVIVAKPTGAIDAARWLSSN